LEGSGLALFFYQRPFARPTSIVLAYGK
jgi:hypothetical protein